MYAISILVSLIFASTVNAATLDINAYSDGRLLTLDFQLDAEGDVSPDWRFQGALEWTEGPIWLSSWQESARIEGRTDPAGIWSVGPLTHGDDWAWIYAQSGQPTSPAEEVAARLVLDVSSLTGRERKVDFTWLDGSTLFGAKLDPFTVKVRPNRGAGKAAAFATPVPEPSSALLFAVGLVFASWCGRRTPRAAAGG